MTEVRLTHVGGPTVLVEVDGWRLLTDPTFDPPGRRYRFGWGTASRKVAGPALAAADVGPVDAVLLTHDHHADNLDDAGRRLLASASVVVTTVPGARRLADGAGGRAPRTSGLQGLAPWATTRLSTHGRPTIEVTATPCRHGPAGSRPIVGEVVGFALRWDGQAHGALWVSGDTVLYDGVLGVADRVDVGTVLLHPGGVRFPVTGPVHYTMRARDGIELCARLAPRTVVPVHYEGWSHFREGRDGIERELARAPAAVRRSVRWATPGQPLEVEV